MVLILAGCLCISPTLTGRAAAEPEPAKAKVITRAQAPSAEDVQRAEAMASPAARGVAVGDKQADINTGVNNVVDGTRLLHASQSRGDDFGAVLAVIIIAGGVAIIIAASYTGNTPSHSTPQ